MKKAAKTLALKKTTLSNLEQINKSALQNIKGGDIRTLGCPTEPPTRG